MTSTPIRPNSDEEMRLLGWQDQIKEEACEFVDRKAYSVFLDRKSQLGGCSGFAPLWIPDKMFDFQKFLLEWSLLKGRGAVLADCGLGKTFIELAWAQNVLQKTNRPVLILTPLAVGQQTVDEGVKFGIEATRSRDGKHRGGIIVTNYEKLHHFDALDFAGVVCDESSILKHFSGATQSAVTRFMLKVPYRLLGTATAAPNDYIELGTSSEALGELGYTDMLARFFKQTDNKPHRMQEIKEWRAERMRELDGNHFGKLSYKVHQSIGQWRLKGHAVKPFWRWVASWARAIRTPGDLGFDDGPFILPELIEREHIVDPTSPPEGMLFTFPAFGLKEERDERRRTLDERCELVAKLVDHNRPAVIWCHLNVEGDRLERAIPGSVQVKGSMSDEAKEEAYAAFRSGEVRDLITKPKIGAWGLNWQHCNHVVTFASHSYEQFYQSVRRCWRFGQKRAVTVDIVSTAGEQYVRENMSRKAEACSVMFRELVGCMVNAMRVERQSNDTARVEIPSWV
jgi:superfamily II DNA or RNA helicase